MGRCAKLVSNGTRAASSTAQGCIAELLSGVGGFLLYRKLATQFDQRLVALGAELDPLRRPLGGIQQSATALNRQSSRHTSVP